MSNLLIFVSYLAKFVLKRRDFFHKHRYRARSFDGGHVVSRAPPVSVFLVRDAALWRRGAKNDRRLTAASPAPTTTPRRRHARTDHLLYLLRRRPSLSPVSNVSTTWRPIEDSRRPRGTRRSGGTPDARIRGPSSPFVSGSQDSKEFARRVSRRTRWRAARRNLQIPTFSTERCDAKLMRSWSRHRKSYNNKHESM